MKHQICLLLAVVLAVSLIAGCQKPEHNSAERVEIGSEVEAQENQARGSGQTLAQTRGRIYLFGERHGVDNILDRELELWNEYYNDEGLRHLFVELPYYGAEYLNLWMQQDNDDILDALFNDWAGTNSGSAVVKEFYRSIKRDCPETVFHGTDVGHSYDNTGARFLEYLESNGLTDTDQYALSQEAVVQGEEYRRLGDGDEDIYRETIMAENFVREFDALGGESVMGIYGSAHTELGAQDTPDSIPNLASQLSERYGDIIYSENLVWAVKNIEPIREESVTVNGNEYVALYFGGEDISWHDSFAYREFWRLEGAFQDFSESPANGDWLPAENYPMLLEPGQIFFIDYTQTDGAVIRLYYRTNELEGNGLTTEGFEIDG